MQLGNQPGNLEPSFVFLCLFVIFFLLFFPDAHLFVIILKRWEWHYLFHACFGVAFAVKVRMTVTECTMIYHQPFRIERQLPRDICSSPSDKLWNQNWLNFKPRSTAPLLGGGGACLGQQATHQKVPFGKGTLAPKVPELPERYRSRSPEKVVYFVCLFLAMSKQAPTPLGELCLLREPPLWASPIQLGKIPFLNLFFYITFQSIILSRLCLAAPLSRPLQVRLDC